ncbi:hypothetical protein B9Z65_4444 [Elsinoe australis]|uniref:Dynein light intermediate chain n=1 Tax=Elsinoe australis TaxID=40998 RepID=A0A2P7Z2T5_9PEZI|nr:hypothetical protein B9Z65_4444 [Elsinoe australis]
MTTTARPPATHAHHPSTSTTSSAPPIWPTLLSTVSTSSRLPRKQLLLLGGTPQSQTDLIATLAPARPPPPSRRDRTRTPRPVPLANAHALGYTYRDLPTSDGEDVLARLNVYTLPDASGAYAPLVKRLLTAETIPHTSVAVLLDWSRPWDFAAEVRAWVLLLKKALQGLGREEEDALDGNREAWMGRREEGQRSEIVDTVGGGKMPLGQGEFDEALGLQVNFVVGEVGEMERLERERGWKEGEFDFVLQFLRTVGLKLGAGVVYRAPGAEGEVRGVVLGGLVEEERGERVRHNVVDRESVVVPPGWDSWGKIRVLREGFDIEGFSRAWGVDLQDGGSTGMGEEDGGEATSTEALYAARIPNPKVEDRSAPKIEVEHTPDQIFMAAQAERLDAFRAEDEVTKKQKSQTRRTNAPDDNNGRPSMNEQIGPVQFNMGGIQYDADEALKRIKARTKQDTTQAQGTPERTRTRESTPYTPGSPPQFEAGKDIPVENLEAYFASLMKGGRGGSVQNSPRVQSPRVVQKGSGEGSSS